MDFPLPAGHVFGPSPQLPQQHQGDENLNLFNAMVEWQRAYNLRVDRDLPITGKFDGPTQRACTTLQRELGLPMTGVLDADTWAAVWTVEGPLPGRVPALAVQAPDAPTEPTEPLVTPSWWPGQEFGDIGEKGPHVTKVLRLMGCQGTVYSQALARRVKGLQRLHGLAPTGRVDLATSRLVGRTVVA